MEKISDLLIKYKISRSNPVKMKEMEKTNGVLTGVSNDNLKLLEDNPEEFWKGVTKIGTEAFADCTALKSITIPNSVTYIGVSAFSRCINLQSVKIPESVTDIKDLAFAGCESLQSIEIPSSVTNILLYTFSGCKNLQSVKIPDSVKYIGAKAFIGCESLQSIEIPSVESFDRESGLFFGCKKLKKLTLPKWLETKNKEESQRVRNWLCLNENVVISFGGKDDNQKTPTDLPHTPTPREKV